MTAIINRRDALKGIGGGLGLLAAAAAVSGTPGALARTVALPHGGPKRLLRLAHLTDLHIMPERRAYEGVTACLRHLRGLSEQPELIITGGDLINDGFGTEESSTRTQFDMLTRVFKDECTIPTEHCLGNHDIFGWNRKGAKASGTEPLYGKKWACDVLGLARWYRSFDRAGFHFVVLDSVQPRGEDGYIGMLDDEQFEWLKGDLAATPAATPVIVVTHIPILSAGTLLINGLSKDRDHGLSGGTLMSDAYRIAALFREHRNVKLVLQGHIHILDKAEFDGVTYTISGAVSGAWWRNPAQDAAARSNREKDGTPRPIRPDEGYALIDLFDDGTMKTEYVTYGWKSEGE